MILERLFKGLSSLTFKTGETEPIKTEQIWFPAGMRLPNTGQRVILFRAKNNYLEIVKYIDAGKTRVFQDRHGGLIKADDIVHEQAWWAYPPELPALGRYGFVNER